MIPASLYQTLYLVFVTLLTIIVYTQYQKSSGLREPGHTITDIVVRVVLIVVTLFIGLRPISSVFIDMRQYYGLFQIFEGGNFNFSWETDNLIYDNLVFYLISIRFLPEYFYLLIAIIYFGAAYLGIRRLFPNHCLGAYLVFLAAFSTFSYGTNGIKAGAATSLFIWALGYRENLRICIPLVLLSWGFHHSMIMVVAAFIVTLFVKNPKYFFWIWGFCFLMAAAHVTAFAHLFAGATTEHGAGYLLGSGENYGTRGGFRFDFIVYSAVPVIVGWYAVMKKKLHVSDLYKKLLSLYLCLNGVWMLCMYAAFTNRIAYLSWFIYPIVLIYPFLNEQWGRDRYKTFGLVMLGHLGFTLFMNVIYYG